MTDYILFNDTTVSRSISKEVKMKKILVFICLMFLSSSAHSMNVRVGGYKEMKEAALGSESVKYLLMG